jgi:hypothetical protein
MRQAPCSDRSAFYPLNPSPPTPHRSAFYPALRRLTAGQSALRSALPRLKRVKVHFDCERSPGGFILLATRDR